MCCTCVPDHLSSKASSHLLSRSLLETRAGLNLYLQVHPQDGKWTLLCINEEESVQHFSVHFNCHDIVLPCKSVGLRSWNVVGIPHKWFGLRKRDKRKVDLSERPVLLAALRTCCGRSIVEFRVFAQDREVLILFSHSTRELKKSYFPSIISGTSFRRGHWTANCARVMG